MKKKVSYFRSGLTNAVASGDINRCCGILRRVFAETVSDDLFSLKEKDIFSHRNEYGRSRLTSSSELKDTVRPNASEGNRNGDFLEEIFQLGRTCLKEEKNLVRASSISVLCHVAQRNHRWREALWFSEYLSDPPSPTFIASLLDPGNTGYVMKHCNEKGWDIDTINGVRHLSGKYGCWSAALELAQAAEKQAAGGESFSYGVLIPHLAKSGKEEKAKSLFALGVAQGSFTNDRLVQQLLTQTFFLGQWKVGIFMLDKLVSTQETTQLLTSNTEFYRDIMGQIPDWRSSLTLFHLARAAEARPDERMVNIVLSLCHDAGAWSEATRIYELAKEEKFMDTLVNSSSYHTLVKAFSAIRQWEKALEALSWMTKASDAAGAAGKSELVELCQEAGQWEAALAVGLELFDDQPELLSQQTLLHLLLACAKGGKWDTAMRIFKKQKSDLRLTPHPLSVCAVLQSCVAAERWSEALALLGEARKDQVSTVLPPMAHRLVIKACATAGKWETVISLLQTMKEDGLPHDNESQRLGMWAAALEGQWELSLRFLQNIPKRARTMQDRLLIRGATRLVGPEATSAALRYLQSK